MSTLPMGEIRARAAAALAPDPESELTVFDNVVDALDPPALVLGWDDPWLTPGTSETGATFGPCLYLARFSVLCVAGRVEPDPGIELLEQLLEYVESRLRADAYQWPPVNAQSPRKIEIGGITYLGARANYGVTVTLNGG